MSSFTPPPRALRRAKLDNLALLPASLLPFKAEYQAIANQQAPGTTLVVLPAGTRCPAERWNGRSCKCRRRGNWLECSFRIVAIVLTGRLKYEKIVS